jgi:NIMA (never in mitosis gene a)-related kinase
MSMQDFELICKVGDGSYSTVYKVKRVVDGCVYALKKVRLEHLSAK